MLLAQISQCVPHVSKDIFFSTALAYHVIHHAELALQVILSLVLVVVKISFLTTLITHAIKTAQLDSIKILVAFHFVAKKYVEMESTIHYLVMMVI